MNLYNKTLAQLERKVPKIKYVSTFEPISTSAKRHFGLEKGYTKGAPVHQSIDNSRDQNFSREYIFYYQDVKETEAERIATVTSDAVNSYAIRKSGLIHGRDYLLAIKRINLE